VIDAIRELDVESLTPEEALELMGEWQQAIAGAAAATNPGRG
jgi:hypothetical protein